MSVIAIYRQLIAIHFPLQCEERGLVVSLTSALFKRQLHSATSRAHGGACREILTCNIEHLPMSHSPAPMSPWPVKPNLVSHPGFDPAHSETKQDFERPEAVLKALRVQVAADEMSPQVSLDAIILAAQSVTGASGAALGMRRGSAVLCLGRSGETSPELGVRLSENSGISGECLRSGRTLRCGDTETDPRVDAEACRALNIRSIVAVPVRSSDSTVGVLEVFSTSPRAFTDEHIAFLSSLAGLVETASSIEDNGANPSWSASHTGKSSAESMESLLTSVLQLGPPWWRLPKWRYSVLAGIALIALLSIANWWFWRAPVGEGATLPATMQPVRTIGDGAPAPTIAETLPKAEPGRVALTTRTSIPKEPLVHASKKDAEPLVRRFNIAPPADGSEGSFRPVPGDESLTEPPELPSQNAHTYALPSGIVSGAVAIPSLGIPVSRGVTPPEVERRVKPIYPAQALALHLEGTVVVKAWVNERGRVDQVNLVSGNPLLSKPAIEAVKKWRFHAALLNGKPTRM